MSPSILAETEVAPLDRRLIDLDADAHRPDSRLALLVGLDLTGLDTDGLDEAASRLRLATLFDDVAHRCRAAGVPTLSVEECLDSVAA